MNFTVSRYALSHGAMLALLAGCGGSQPPIAVPGATTQASRPTPHADLLYVVMAKGEVNILSYPAGAKVGTLKSAEHTDAPIVSDPLNGDILINVRGALNEYAHGGQKPILQIHPPPSYGQAVDYAFDPTSNDIAVSFQAELSSVSGTVAVYQLPSAQPTIYTVPNMYVPAFLGYDAQGNLFVDGKSNLEGRYPNLLAELPKGAQHFEDISLNESLSAMGSIQWDGSYITIADAGSIYQLNISGDTATVASTVSLKGAWAKSPLFWIQGSTVLGDYLSANRLHNGRVLGLWHYPQGGNAYKTLDVGEKNDTILSEAVSAVRR